VSFANSERRLADALVKNIEERIMSRMGTMAFLDYRFGTIAAVNGTQASVYLGGDPVASPGFVIPAGMTVSVNDNVGVVVNRRGDR
jgi:hypothetical protein